MTGCNYDRLLRALCQSGGPRVITGNPWLVTAGERTYAAATDGSRALYLDTAYTDTGHDATTHLRNFYEPYPEPNLAGLLTKAPDVTHRVDRKALLAAIGPGEPVTWVVEVCDYCGGTGKYNPGAPRPVGCHVCSGTGKVYRRSDHEHRIPLFLFGIPELIDAQLARGIFEHLQGDPISLAARPGIVVFRGPGWAFLVAPLNTGIRHPERSVATIPVATARIQPAEPSA